MQSRNVLIATFILLTAAHARAQLPAARLSTVFPPGAQRGTSVDVAVAGADLDDLARLHFSNPAIVAEPKLDPAGKPVPNVFTVRVGKDVHPGAYDVSAAGRFGVTNPRAFVVDREPQSVSPATNTTPAAAVEVAVNAGVYAFPAGSASQYYKFNLKANQRVFVEADGAAIDSRVDPVLVIFDAAGRELARDGQGDSIDFTAVSDGTYVVQVHDVLYRGGPEYFYRLRIHDHAKVDVVLPAAVRDDEPTALTLFGPNLAGDPPVMSREGRAMKRASVTADDAGGDAADDLIARWFVPPAAAMLDGVQRYQLAGGVNPHFLARAMAALVAEQADNDEPAKAQRVTLPVEVYGQFFPRGDRDWFCFDAKKGESFWVEVTSNRIANFTDPVVLVQRVTNAGKPDEQSVDVREAYEPDNVAGFPKEFSVAHRDPAFGFAAPEDGTYRLLVRDLFNESDDDPRRVYKVSIADLVSRQDFRLVALPQAPQPIRPDPPTTQLWGSNLRPGGVMPVKVVALRTAGFSGDITLTAENLPAGVTCAPVVMNAFANTETLLLAAAENAPPFVGEIRIVGRTTVGDSPLSHTARAGTVVWPVATPDTDALRSRVAQALVIAVTSGEVEPVAVRPTEEKLWENSVAGKFEIPLKVTRRAGYNAAVKLKLASGVSVLADVPEFEIAAGAVDGKLALDVAALKLPPGTYGVYLQTTSTAPYDRDPVKRAAAQAAKDAADKATTDLAAAAAKTPEEKDATVKAVASADEKVKQNEASKAALAEQIKALAPKDTLAYGYSTPITFKITPAPVTFAATAPASAIKPGGKVDVPVTITRLYGFADVVDLSVAIPQGVTGISAANVQIPANAAQATVVIQTGGDAKPGEYALTLSANFKQNNIPLKVDLPVRVQIAAP